MEEWRSTKPESKHSPISNTVKHNSCQNVPMYLVLEIPLPCTVRLISSIFSQEFKNNKSNRKCLTVYKMHPRRHFHVLHSLNF